MPSPETHHDGDVQTIWYWTTVNGATATSSTATPPNILAVTDPWTQVSLEVYTATLAALDAAKAALVAEAAAADLAARAAAYNALVTAGLPPSVASQLSRYTPSGV